MMNVDVSGVVVTVGVSIRVEVSVMLVIVWSYALGASLCKACMVTAHSYFKFPVPKEPKSSTTIAVSSVTRRLFGIMV
jgi:hypothetical protein